MTALVEGEACYCRGSVDTSHTEILLPALSEFVSWFCVLFCLVFWYYALLWLFSVSSMSSPSFLFHVCLPLSPRLLCALPSLSHLSSSDPSHLTCSSSCHQCVCVYSLCRPCIPCQFVCVMSLMNFPVFPLISPLVYFGFLIFAFWFEFCFWLYFALALVATLFSPLTILVFLFVVLFFFCFFGCFFCIFQLFGNKSLPFVSPFPASCVWSAFGS